MVWLLDNYYDVEHRAYLMSEKGMVMIAYYLIVYILCLFEKIKP